MTKRRRNNQKESSKAETEERCYRCGPDEWADDSWRVWQAVEESVQRFVKINQTNIRRSDKKQIATSSYGGGMIDTIKVIRSALGNWAVEQLLAELGIWHRADPVGCCPQVEINVKGGPGAEGMSQEDAKEGKQETGKGPDVRVSA